MVTKKSLAKAAKKAANTEKSVGGVVTSKYALHLLAGTLAALLTNAEPLKVLIGRRVVGVAFNGEGEGTYTLEFDDGSKAGFSSQGDDATFTSVTLTPFQKSVAERPGGTVYDRH